VSRRRAASDAVRDPAAERAARRRAAARAVTGRAVADAAGMALGYALDAALGDPRRFHPVAGYGKLAAALERRTYADDRAAGLRHVGIAVGVPVALAGAAAFATRRRPVLRALVTAALTWTVLGGTSLRREARAMSSSLADGDLAAARRRLPHLAGRDPSTLDSAELARATVESVAENTSDAVVGPLVWGAVGGLPGLVGYRAVNTLDAMVGHRSPRYARFGTAAARADDLANLVPSRLTALLTVATAPTVGGSPARTAWVWLRDGNRHPSPNSGQCEAAVAGALGVRLGGRNVYFGRTEDRPRLGDGPAPSGRDIERAAKLSTVVSAAALGLCVGHILARPLRRAARRVRAR
jgi:adenosylcobinamide-phosphate synthase